MKFYSLVDMINFTVMLQQKDEVMKRLSLAVAQEFILMQW